MFIMIHVNNALHIISITLFFEYASKINFRYINPAFNYCFQEIYHIMIQWM